VYFRDRHPRHDAIEENKTLLKDKYALAKTMGERVNQVSRECKTKVNLFFLLL
jgi:hypothetical protein